MNNNVTGLGDFKRGRSERRRGSDDGSGGQPPEGKPDTRTLIRHATGRAAETVRAITEVLATDTGANPLRGVYCRNSTLVRPALVVDASPRAMAARAEGAKAFKDKGARKPFDALMLTPVEPECAFR